MTTSVRCPECEQSKFNCTCKSSQTYTLTRLQAESTYQRTEYCGKHLQSPSYYCTRKEGHSGIHIAHGGGIVYALWLDDETFWSNDTDTTLKMPNSIELPVDPGIDKTTTEPDTYPECEKCGAIDKPCTEDEDCCLECCNHYWCEESDDGEGHCCNDEYPYCPKSHGEDRCTAHCSDCQNPETACDHDLYVEVGDGVYCNNCKCHWNFCCS